MNEGAHAASASSVHVSTKLLRPSPLLLAKPLPVCRTPTSRLGPLLCSYRTRGTDVFISFLSTELKMAGGTSSQMLTSLSPGLGPARHECQPI